MKFNIHIQATQTKDFNRIKKKPFKYIAFPSSLNICAAIYNCSDGMFTYVQTNHKGK